MKAKLITGIYLDTFQEALSNFLSSLEEAKATVVDVKPMTREHGFAVLVLYTDWTSNGIPVK